MSYLIVSLVLSWINFLFHKYVDSRQLSVTKSTKVCPAQLKENYKSDTFEKARAYSIDKMNFSLVKSFYEMIKDSIVLYSGIIVYFWNFCYDGNEIYASVVLIVIHVTVGTIESIPWSLYSNFVIEERHGFNKQTISFFFKDTLKMYLLSLAIGVPLTTTLVYIIQVTGYYFYFFAFAFLSIVTLVLLYVYPIWIQPLFDNFQEFPESELKTKIYALAAKVGYPLTKLLVVEGSARSSHSNAYLTGFGNNKRIVLYDTLIKGFVFPGKKPEEASTKGCSKDEEIEAVLAHELGHWQYSHIFKHIVVSQINTFTMFYLFSCLIHKDDIYQSFGFEPHQCPIILKLFIIFNVLLEIYSDLFGFFSTYMTRLFEKEADLHAVELGFGKYLKDALVVLSLDNLSFPVHDWLYSTINYSHPTTLERILKIDQDMKKMK